MNKGVGCERLVGRDDKIASRPTSLLIVICRAVFVWICLYFATSNVLAQSISTNFDKNFQYIYDITRSAIMPQLKFFKDNHEERYLLWDTLKTTIGVRLLRSDSLEDEEFFYLYLKKTAAAAGKKINHDGQIDVISIFYDPNQNWSDIEKIINSQIHFNDKYNFPEYITSKKLRDCKIDIFPVDGRVRSGFVGINLIGTAEQRRECLRRASFFLFGVNIDANNTQYTNIATNENKYLTMIDILYSLDDKNIHLKSVFNAVVRRECDAYC